MDDQIFNTDPQNFEPYSNMGHNAQVNSNEQGYPQSIEDQMDLVSNSYKDGTLALGRPQRSNKSSKTERDSQRQAAKSKLQRVIMIGGNKHIGNYRILNKFLGEGTFGKVVSKYFQNSLTIIFFRISWHQCPDWVKSCHQVTW